MKKLIFYSYSKCSTCRKASNWLNQKNFNYELIDIVKESPLPKYLRLALNQYSRDKKKIFNTRGNSFKTIKLDDFNITTEEIIPILINDWTLIRGTFLVFKQKKNTIRF